MPRKRSIALTDGELRIMEVLWNRGPSTVADVTESLRDAGLAYSTVLTMLRILENKGHAKHSKEGRAFIYKPVTQRDQAQEGAVTNLLRRFFGGSPELLVLSLLEGNKIDADEIARLRRKIEDQK